MEFFDYRTLNAARRGTARHGTARHATALKIPAFGDSEPTVGLQRPEYADGLCKLFLPITAEVGAMGCIVRVDTGDRDFRAGSRPQMAAPRIGEHRAEILARSSR